ncbi:MAG: hypothetical protein WED33_09615 [Bacteroidia bacterium]
MMDYPQYRAYFDENTIFEILNNGNFIEIKRTGKYFAVSEIECKLYPEKLFLQDLISASQDGIKVISLNDFEKIKSDWEKTLIKYEFKND